MKQEKTKSKKKVLYYCILTLSVLLLAAAIVLTVYFVTGRSGEVIEAPDPSGPSEPDGPTGPGEPEEPDKPTGGDKVDSNPYVAPLAYAQYTLEYGELYKNQTIGWIYEHLALDFIAEEGEDVFAMANGTVTEVSYHERLGDRITIDHGNGLVSIYTSVTPIAGLGKGQKVQKGEKIGEVQNEGAEKKDGVHLHFEVKENGYFVNPTKYFDAVLTEK